MDILSIALGILALIVAFPNPRRKVQYYFKRLFKIRIVSKEIKDEPVPFRIPLVLRPGSQFIETAFSLPIPEDALFRQVLKPMTRILAISQAGFGKTQLTKELHKKIIVENPSTNIAYLSSDMRKKGPLHHQISMQFDEDRSDLPSVIKEGDFFVIIIDGLDELHDDERKNLLNEVEEWIVKGASVFATARSISSLPSKFRMLYDFFSIQPLNEEKIFDLIERWGRYENFSNTQEIKEQIQSQLGEESIWAPGEYDIAYTSPFYLVNSCKYFVETGEIPPNRILILERIVSKSLISFDNPALAEKVLIKIAEMAGISISSVSLPMVNMDILESTLSNWDELKGVDCRLILDRLLNTDLIVKVGDSVSFGIHGLLYHLYTAKSLINKGNIAASDLKKLQRSTVELILTKLPNEDSISICEELLNEVEKIFPQGEKIVLDDEPEIDPLIPYYGLSSVNVVTKEVVDRFVESGINRFRLKDGPTRWKGVEMVTSLGQHARASHKLVDAINKDEPEVAADVAEVLCWLGNKRRGWRKWAIEKLEIIAKYLIDPHPLFHVMEAVERLKIEKNPIAVNFLRHLSEHEDELVQFLAVSLLGENKGRWLELSSSVFKWIQIREKKNEMDYKICHGYHAIHWFSHPVFGNHPEIEKAKELVKNRVLMLCESENCPFYWIWYLGKPIKQLELFVHCKEKFGSLLVNKNIPDESKRSIRNFIISVGGSK